MKYHFTMVVNGEDTLKTKIEEAIKNHPKIHIDIIKSFAQAIMLAFHLNEEDNIRVESFTAGRMEEDKNKTENKPQSEDERNWGKPGAYVSGS